MAGQLRNPILILEPLAAGSPSIRAPLIELDALAEGASFVRASLVAIDALAEGNRNLRTALMFVEAFVEVPPGGHVSTALFPGSLGSPQALPGLAYAVHKRPGFSTAAFQGASGFGVRRANMQYPIWEFELTYEFLRDDVTNEYKTLLGFYLSRKGAFDTFLFKDPDDYLVTNGTLATADGTTTQFGFMRTLGGFAELVGQVDQGHTITVYGTTAEARTIPGTPFQITVTNSATFVADGGVTKAGVPMVKVGSSPAAGQYSVAAGVYTFAAADTGAAVIITYRYSISPAAYTVTLPNQLVFAVAPAAGLILSADFQFFFNCKFQDDHADFQKFANGFWDLQKIVLETVPQ